MTRYGPGDWMPFTMPHGRRVVGKPAPPVKRKHRATKPKRRKRKPRRQ